MKECRTEKFILQKLIYVHNNPCTERWRLAEKPCEYPYSSARFYDGDKAGYKERLFGCAGRIEVWHRMIDGVTTSAAIDTLNFKTLRRTLVGKGSLHLIPIKIQLSR